jgi:hypothetical protein
MKKIKMLMFASALLIALGAAFAFNMPAKKQVEESYFKLKDGGEPLERTDWVPADAGSCPTEHSNVVCRILAVDDDGMPSEDSFNAILSNSADFGQAYTDKVTYVEP